MALTLDLPVTDIGSPISGAYLRIVKFDGDKEWVRIYVEAHTNEQARQDSRTPILRTSHAVAPDTLSGALLPALYGALKAVYADATDC